MKVFKLVYDTEKDGIKVKGNPNPHAVYSDGKKEMIIIQKEDDHWTAYLVDDDMGIAFWWERGKTKESVKRRLRKRGYILKG